MSELIFVGYTNGSQIKYAQDDEGCFYPDTDNECYIPLYMLKTHQHRVESTSKGEYALVKSDHIAQLENERDLAQEQIKSLFERVSGVEVSEYTPESMDYLADMIEGQMDADNGCIDKLKKEKVELVEALDSATDLLLISGWDDKYAKDVVKITQLLERMK